MATIPVKVCKVCRTRQLSGRHSPRNMKVLPTWTAGSNQQKRKYPVFVCEVCDGPALSMAYAKARKAEQ